MTIRVMRSEDTASAAALDPAWTREAFLAEHRMALVVEGSNRSIAGWVLLSVVPPEAEILNIVVAPEFRRRGFGIALLQEVLERLRKAGVSRVWLEVRESNTPAQRLYRRSGFTQVGRRPQYYQHPTEDALLLSLTLAGL